MIAHSYICLRCQHHLAKRSRPSKTQIALIFSQSRRWQSKTSLDDPQDDEGLHAPIKRPLKLSRRPLGLPKHVSEYPLGKLYGFTGQKLRENREKLSIDVLGEQAEVIVLRDSKINNYNNYRYEDVVETEREIQVDILAQLNEERGLVGWEEVVRNINELRPKKDQPLQTREQFNDLRTVLQDGFTASQLAKYLQTYGQSYSARPDSIAPSPALHISAWIPGISNSEDPLGIGPLRGYDLKSYTSKQRLIVRILRDCWDVEQPILEEGIGQIEVELKPHDLDLLLSGKKSVLDEIHLKYIIEATEGLEIFKSNDAKRSRNTVRITSTRNKCYLLVEAIGEKLKSIHRVQLPLKALVPRPKQGNNPNFEKWANKHFDDTIIQRLGRITNTEIQKTPQGSLLITSIDSNTTTAFSTRSDIAQRLLITSGIISSDREKNWVGYKDAQNAARRTFVNFPFIDGLSWREKLYQWSRWVNPITKDSIIGDQATKILVGEDFPTEAPLTGFNDSKTLPQVESAFHTDVLKAQREKVDSQTSDIPHWSENIDVQSSALMGAVLHDQTQSIAKNTAGAPLFIDANRSFSTTVPGLSRILSSASISQSKGSEDVVMCFLPNPLVCPSAGQRPIGAAALSAFPFVEMHFAVDAQTKSMSLNFVHAILSTENSDLMLPDSAMDIRFQQKTSSQLHYNEQNLPQGIADFLGSSNLSLDYSRGGLQTPPSLEIPIAAHLCNKEAFKPSDSKIISKTQNVEYLFTGLEIRNTISMAFQGWELLYTSIEAGKAGGRRGELRLCPTRIIKPNVSEAETEDAFVETAVQLADSYNSQIQSSRPIVENLIKMVTTSKQSDGVDVDRTFKYFTKRPTIVTGWR